MPRIQLRIYVDPGQAEVIFSVLRTDGSYERLSGVIDTGAEVSLLPNDLLNKVVYRPIGSGTIIIDQAGIARQSFEAMEAFVTGFLEDQTGAQSDQIEARVWFADTEITLIGFDGILDRAVLHIDMHKRDGWIAMEA